VRSHAYVGLTFRTVSDSGVFLGVCGIDVRTVSGRMPVGASLGY